MCILSRMLFFVKRGDISGLESFQVCCVSSSAFVLLVFRCFVSNHHRSKMKRCWFFCCRVQVTMSAASNAKAARVQVVPAALRVFARPLATSLEYHILSLCDQEAWAALLLTSREARQCVLGFIRSQSRLELTFEEDASPVFAAVLQNCKALRALHVRTESELHPPLELRLWMRCMIDNNATTLRAIDTRDRKSTRLNSSHT